MRKLTCQEVLDQLADYLDDGADATLIEEVNLHLGKCHDCKVEVDCLKQVVMIYRHEERVFLPEPLHDRLQAALEQAYRERKDDSAEPGATDAPNKPEA